MFNTVSKFEFGLAAAALLLAIGATVVDNDPAAFVLIFGVCSVLLLSALAIAISGFQDQATEYPATEDAPPVQMITVGSADAPRPSIWPFAGALALGIVAIGVAVDHTLVLIGLACGALIAAGWLSQAWRADPAFTPREGARISGRLLTPVGLPIMALSLIVIIVASVSRILLALPRAGSILVAFVLAICLLLAFFALSARPNLGRNTLVFLGGFAVVAVVSAGSVSAANGYRTFEHHDTGPGPLTIQAKGTAFNRMTLTVIAGQHTTITFKNLDPVYHNVAVYSNDGTPYWNGEPIKGSKKITYNHVFDMAPGTYTFRCDFHPTSMVGTFIVQAAQGSQGTP
jgi:plastocyanin